MTRVETVEAALWAACPHLDRARDGNAVGRLVRCYVWREALDARLDRMNNAPLVSTRAPKTALLDEIDLDPDTVRTIFVLDVSKIMDEVHRLNADALRLEQELGVTPAARRRQGLNDKPKRDGVNLEGAKT